MARSRKETSLRIGPIRELATDRRQQHPPKKPARELRTSAISQGNSITSKLAAVWYPKVRQTTAWRHLQRKLRRLVTAPDMTLRQRPQFEKIERIIVKCRLMWQRRLSNA